MDPSLKTDFYVHVDDPVYDTARQIPLDKSTDNVQLSIISASSGSGMTNQPFVNTGLQTTFDRTLSSISRMMWNQSALELHIKFSGAANAIASPAVNVCPPWNLLSLLIDSLTLRFNGKTEIFRISGKHYFGAFTAHHLRTYTQQQLNSMNSHLFTPIGGGSLLAKLPDGIPHSAATGYSFDPDSNSTSKWVGVKNDAATQLVAGTTSPVNPLTYDLDGVVTSSYNAPATLLHSEYARARYERYMRYIGSYASATQDKTHVIRIPLSDLFCGIRSQAVFTNLNSYQIEINWAADDGTFLESFGSTSNGFAHVVGCQLIEGQYLMSVDQQGAHASKKAGNGDDQFSFLFPNTQVFNWNGSEIIKSSVLNMSEIMLFQNLRGMQNITGTGAGYLKYTSAGQLCLGPSPQASANVVVKGSNLPGSIGATTLQVKYGDIMYPEVACVLRRGNGLNDYESLLFEHLRASNDFSDRTRGQKIDKFLFESELTFAHFRFNAPTGAYKRRAASDLTIKLDASALQPIAENQAIYVICFCLQSVTIQSDGNVLVAR